MNPPMMKRLGIAGEKRKNRGFTLVEVVLALALSSFTLGVIYHLYLYQVKNQAIRENILDMQQQARAALDLVSRELQMAGLDPRGVNRDALKGNDFFGITFDLSELAIHADLNGNGVPTDSNESIVISHDSDTMTLRRNTGGGRQPVSENIETFSVKYFDREGKITTHSENIRQVEVSITARTEKADPQYPYNGGYRKITLQSRVTPRNLGL
ncbi:MAG: prepilin-type N-terminal cleavage/methylation domain-containing protein [Nitrospirota bacterium]|nr:MAG: prepilin-type N-terminal cleavage/methylation domain-containing protein [Nitrospirota bacterium]